MTDPSTYLTQYQPEVTVDLEKTITLDFETYWDSKDYSLKKMSMEEYIRDPRFLVHGLGMKQGDRPTRYFAGQSLVSDVLAGLPMDRADVVGQNAAFDGLILSEIFNVHPRRILCTQAMAAMAFGNTLSSVSLHSLTNLFLPGQVKDAHILQVTDGKRNLTDAEQEAMADYCNGDVDKTWALFKKFLPLIDQSVWNLDFIDMVTRMYTDPTLWLEPHTLAELVANEGIAKQQALDNCSAGNMQQIRSNPQFATLLQSLGVDPPRKISLTTGKETWAFAKDDRGFERLLRHEDPRVRDLVAARLRIKTSINETRAQSYLEVAHRGTWPVHLYVSGARTTHRLSGGAGGGGNPQNLGKKSPLRAAILPPPGYQLLVADSSGIEMRGQMALANETAVVERLKEPDFDLYSVFACEIFGVTDASTIQKKQRDTGKVAMLSLGFGSGAAKFHHTAWTWGLNLTEEEAARIVSLYRATFHRIPRAWDVCGRILSQLARGEEESTWFDHIAKAVVNGPMGHPAILMPATGLYITYPNLRREYDEEEGRFVFRYDTYSYEEGRSGKLERVNLYGAKVFQHIIQSSCRNVVVAQSLAADQFLRKEISHQCRTVMHVHDESVHLIPMGADAEAALNGVLKIYATPPPFWNTLPTFGEAAIGDNYATAKP